MARESDPSGRPPSQSMRGGRHTLGSDPALQEPAAHVMLPDLPGAPMEVAEPLHTIHGAAWRDARDRTRLLGPPLQAMCTALLDHVEAGWAHVRRLQRWYEDHREDALERSDDYAHLLRFIDGDLIDLFREVAAGVAALVPGYPDWEAEADPEGVEGELDRFVRYFTVFRHAVETIGAPADLRDDVRAAAQTLGGWHTELAALLAASRETVLDGFRPR